ncbi:biotin transporter BioY [Paenibacillus sp. HB172176]|uniref:biotin transporter BioY n=1 Tax=Paenibacillus sp. HB172176 TaxID=2493690 RepID=UPI00143BA139|nr:biotin transporter BioY [Paenibacillus sp. HB172176]
MHSRSIRSIVFIALFAALFIVLSEISIKLTASLVPFTLQTLAVILCGLFLKPRDAFVSIFIIIVLAAFGLPLFSGQGGISTLIGYTGGFIAYFPFGALLISLFVEKVLGSAAIMRSKTLLAISLFIVFEVCSSLLCYIPGVSWFMYSLHYDFQKAMTASCYPYLLGDAIKAAFGVIIALSLKPYIVKFRKSNSGTASAAAATHSSSIV